MGRWICIIAFFLVAGMFSYAKEEVILVPTQAPHNEKVELVCRIPSQAGKGTVIMVLFGGRNWEGGKTLEQFAMCDWANEMNVLLVAPSFHDDDYWDPRAWSGRALSQAVNQLQERYGIENHKLLYYGYSAGAQCANLFYAYAELPVLAWAAHACGVFPLEKLEKISVPALVTCGKQDRDRWQISRDFIFRYREAGGRILWKDYEGGHELQEHALRLAKAFFTTVLKNEKFCYVGDDDSRIVYPLCERNRVQEEYRNYLTKDEVLTLWEESR